MLLPTAVTCFVLEWMARERPPVPRRWLGLAMFLGLPLPVLFVNRWTLSREPMWGNVVARLDFYTPDPFRLALGLGAAFFIVILTFDGFLRPNRSAGERMAKAWLLVVLAFAYVPMFNWRYHLLNGIQIPLAILATQGLRRTAFRAMLRRRSRASAPWWPRVLRGWAGVRTASGAVIVLCCLSGVNLILSYGYEAGQVAEPTYLPKAEVAALDWMRREVPRDALVLATYATGNYIPRLAGQRVFVELNETRDRLGRSGPRRIRSLDRASPRSHTRDSSRACRSPIRRRGATREGRACCRGSASTTCSTAPTSDGSVTTTPPGRPSSSRCTRRRVCRSTG